MAIGPIFIAFWLLLGAAVTDVSWMWLTGGLSASVGLFVFILSEDPGEGA